MIFSSLGFRLQFAVKFEGFIPCDGDAMVRQDGLEGFPNSSLPINERAIAIEREHFKVVEIQHACPPDEVRVSEPPNSGLYSHVLLLGDCHELKPRSCPKPKSVVDDTHSLLR